MDPLKYCYICRFFRRISKGTNICRNSDNDFSEEDTDTILEQGYSFDTMRETKFAYFLHVCICSGCLSNTQGNNSNCQFLCSWTWYFSGQGTILNQTKWKLILIYKNIISMSLEIHNESSCSLACLTPLMYCSVSSPYH